MNIIKKAETMLLILLIGTVSSIIFHYTRFAFIGNKAPFLDTFLHNPINIFCDYYSIDDGFSRFGYKITLFYFPFTFFILGGLQKIAVNNPYLLMQILLGIYFILLVPIFFKSLNLLEIRLRIICIFTLIFLNYPMLHSLHTGNFETICFICFLYSLAFAKHDSPVIAAIILAPAIAIKLYPIIFVLTFIDKYNYKRVLFALFFSTLFFILIGFIFKGNYFENIKDYLNGVIISFNNYSSIMVSSTSGLAFGHSIANSLKIIFPAFNASNLIHPIITLIGVPIFLYSCFLAYRTNFYIYKIILPLSSFCLFTPTSTDYRLLYFTLPVIIIINSKTDYKFTYHYLIMLCLLLIPKDYYFFNGDLYQNINSIINTLLLLILLVFTIRNAITLNKYSQ